MKITTQIKHKAAGIFGKQQGVDTLFVNPRGAFFTNENLALNSVESSKDLTELKRADIEAFSASELKKEADKKAADEKAAMNPPKK